MNPLPSFDDLVGLFGSGPTSLDDDAFGPDERATDGWRLPWPYTAVTFRAVRSGYNVELLIEPGYHHVRVQLRATDGGADLVHLDLTGVRTVGVERAKGRELLRVDFPDDAPAATLWLRMKPDVTLQWSYDTMG